MVDMSGSENLSGGWGGAGGYSQGSAGGDDASVNLGNDGEAAPDPYRRYEALCGEGECVPGPQEACSVGGDDDGEDDGGAEGLPAAACQLVPGDDGHATPACGATGPFAAGEPCGSAADCAPGLGCVATGEMAGTCRQYCCGHVEDCSVGTHCAPQPMQENRQIQIPVCIPATGCNLLSNDCGAEQTCAIVRADGSTSCIPRGAGQVGDECPCDDGFVCSMLTNSCKKLCRLGESATDCGQMAQCQGGSMGFPAGFGICVGGNY
ncbi:uncharacterized protein CMC5_081870 [Chondromyces crocatus]|uniref:Uncharacterized protein n=2 Tax=Chondromyces crocatus TaxID=52 RepID=A0A0K1ESN8_CHOCO|nr:uncharacterized protein CMC5_081870 [Chondromyces crocatus]